MSLTKQEYSSPTSKAPLFASRANVFLSSYTAIILKAFACEGFYFYIKRGKRAEITVSLKARRWMNSSPCFLYCKSLFLADVDIFAVILEKVVIQNDWYLFEQCCVNAFTLENAVNICSITAQLFCKPRNRTSLIIKLLFYDISNMNHICLECSVCPFYPIEFVQK